MYRNCIVVSWVWCYFGSIGFRNQLWRTRCWFRCIWSDTVPPCHQWSNTFQYVLSAISLFLPCTDYRVASKPGPFSKVCNSCIWWHRKTIHIAKCSVLFVQSETGVLNFVTVSPVEQYCIENNDSPFVRHGNFPILQPTRGCQSTEWSAYQNVQYSVRSEVDVFEVHCMLIVQWNDTVLKTAVHHLHVTWFVVYQSSWKQITCHQVVESQSG